MDRLTQFFRSFRTLVVIGALAAPMLLLPRVSFAYLSGPLSPLYVLQGYMQNSMLCTGGVASINHTGGLCSSFHGYVNTAQDPGTSPIYALGNWSSRFGCFAGIASMNNTGGNCATFLGYANTTQIAGTVPLYALTNWSSRFGCSPGIAAVNNTGGNCATLLGYVYNAIPAPTLSTISIPYHLGSVIYMPPGSGGSKVQYGALTQIGTTVTMENSFTTDASAQVNLSFDKAGGSITFGYSWGGTTTTSVDIENSVAANQAWTGPASNTIDHDFDIIVLYTGVLATISTDYLGHNAWGLDYSQITSSVFGYWANVGCLNPNSAVYSGAVCGSQQGELALLGVTSDMYPDILPADPFWDPNNQPQTLTSAPIIGRYVSVEPTPSTPYNPGFDGGTLTVTDTNSENVVNTTIATDSHSTGFSLRLGPPVANLTISDKVTITNKATTSNHVQTQDTSTFTITMPSSTQSNPYTGPATLYIYRDTIYKTFMFSFIPPPPPQ